MRQIILSNLHTKENIDFLLDYIKKLITRIKIDNIVINGNILGINEIRKGYGYGYNKNDFHFTLKKDELFREAAQDSYENIKKIISMYKQGELIDDSRQEILGKHISEYMNTRYDYVVETLKRFSKIKKTYFNMGKYESPLNYLVLKEVSFLLDVSFPMIKKSILYTSFRDVYKTFKEKIKELEGKDFRYIAGKPIIEKGYILAGIPGLNSSSVPTDKSAELQENQTKDLLNSIKRHFSYSKKLILYNTVEGRMTKNPFTFRPGSAAIRKFIQETKDKLKMKLFIQSYYNWVSTHFYKRDDFHFLLNNSAANNGLFNILDIAKKIRCFDVDSKKNKIRELKSYNSYIADYSTPKQRLSLNYKNPEEIIKQRNLKECFYL
ncbi:hypothetical protein GF327_02035 [Candidatus Woesearchaeota archaeon]|nr:hypothetical protein [Candidatus Woesearchaeota archaeon]